MLTLSRLNYRWCICFLTCIRDVNTATLSNSKYGDKHCFIGVAQKNGVMRQIKWSMYLLWVCQGGRFNYIYGGDINNDGSPTNDLIYVPTTAQLQTMVFNPIYTSKRSKSGLWYLISQDSYLSGRRGQYAERYGALSPWEGNGIWN
jgi:hypothetical protein